MDESITHWINTPAGNNPLIDLIMTSVTQFGVPIIVLLVVLQWWSKHEKTRIRHVCFAAGLAFLIGLGLNQIILLFLHRVRPYDVGVSHLIIGQTTDWSFPSDHATAIFAITATFLLHGLKGRGAAFLAAALLICISRVYVGTHYVSDVIGGAVMGTIAAVLVRALYWEGTRVDRRITALL